MRGFAQVYWDTGNGFRDEDSSRLSLTSAPGAADVLRFVLPRRPITALRFDPIDSPGESSSSEFELSIQHDGARVAASREPVARPSGRIDEARGQRNEDRERRRRSVPLCDCSLPRRSRVLHSLSAVTPLSLALSILAATASARQPAHDRPEGVRAQS